MPSLNDFSFPALAEELVRAGVNPIHTKALWASIYRGKRDFLPPLKRWHEESIPHRYSFDTPEVTAAIPSSDGLTRKYLLKLSDGQEVETVLMGYTGRYTACLSTQAGCAMGCTFCATGQMGFARHLRPGEIVAQVLHCQSILRQQYPEAENAPGSLLRNLVFMGMGEPLHNYDSVMTALDIITERSGINIGPSKITISTVGVVPNILRLADEKRPYNLAVSLHGATEEERAALVPVSRKWPLAEVIAACRYYNEAMNRRILFGWTLIEGKNDAPEQAHRLAELLQGIDSHVNLIPLNPTNGFNGVESSRGAAVQFQRILQEAGIPSTIRQRRGIDVAAGCGQLQAIKKKRQA